MTVCVAGKREKTKTNEREPTEFNGHHRLRFTDANRTGDSCDFIFGLSSTITHSLFRLIVPSLSLGQFWRFGRFDMNQPKFEENKNRWSCRVVFNANSNHLASLFFLVFSIGNFDGINACWPPAPLGYWPSFRLPSFSRCDCCFILFFLVVQFDCLWISSVDVIRWCARVFESSDG